MTKRTGIILCSILIVYCLVLFCLAVLSREPASKSIVWLDLLGGYTHPRNNSVSNGLLNICSFIPVGVLVGLLTEKYRIGKAILVGLLVSIVIEFSQLIWKRGVFDVDDFLNDAVGALIGGLLVVCVMSIRKKAITKRI